METPEQMIGKAVIDSTTSTATWLIRNTEQVRSFISQVIDETTMMKIARHLVIDGPSLDIANYDIAMGQISGGLGETTAVTADDRVIPEFGGRNLTPVNFDVRFDISQTRLIHDNIINGALTGELTNAVQRYIGNGIEDIVINSSTGGTGPAAPAGANTGYYTSIDGLREKSLSGHIYDHSNGYVNPELFKGMLSALPTKWRGPATASKLRYFTSVKLVDEYSDYLSRRTTPLGDLRMTQDGALAYRGIPIVPVPFIKDDDYPGALAYSGTTSGFGWVLLTMEDNIVVGWGPEMRMGSHPSEDLKTLFVSWWGACDTNYPLIDAVVTATNLQPTIDPTLAPAY